MRPAPFYRLLLAMTKALFVPLYRLRVDGAERIPATGPVLIASNHVSYWDAVFLQIACPRPIRWMMDEAYYRLPVLNALFRALGCIPVKVAGGNRAALTAAVEALRAEGVVGIFPEGQLSRTGRMGRAHSGVAAIAMRARAAVVPAYLRGAFATWPKGQSLPRLSRVEVRFGEPLYLRRREDVSRDALQGFAWRLMREIKGLFGHGHARHVGRPARHVRGEPPPGGERRRAQDPPGS